MGTRTVRSATCWVALVVVLLALAVRTSSDGTTSSRPAGASAGSDAAAHEGAAAPGKAAAGVAPAAASTPAGRPARAAASAPGAPGAPGAPRSRQVEYRADIKVRVPDVERAAAEAERIAEAAGGLVFGHRVTGDPAGTAADTGDGATAPGQGTDAAAARRRQRMQAQLTLRVPPAAFRPLLRDLAALGGLLGQNSTAEDVTEQVIDTDSRLASQQATLRRMRALLARADTVGDVVRVEGELARREADLEAQRAQQAGLRSRTELATVVATFSGAPPAGVAGATVRDRGFLTGLKAGWSGLTRAMAVAVTVLGAVLPFVLPAAAVLVPARLAWRARRRRLERPAASTP